MLVSLIIPVYNVEGFLERCLDSVKSQTYKDLEVIIVNDGSTDRSPQIIDKYVAENPGFKAFTIKNRGLGGARNYGMEKATGEFVVFLDSDDYISADCIQKMSQAATVNQSDIVVCNSCDVTENGEPISYYKNNIKNETVSLSDCPELLFNRPCAWAKMYRRRLFEGLSFVAREWYEDLRLVLKLYLRAERITYIEDTLFFYVQRQGSIMNNKNAERNLEIISAFEDLISYFRENGVYDRFKNELYYLVTKHIAVAAVTRVSLSNTKDKKAVLIKLQNYLDTFDGLYDNKYMSNLDRNKRLILFFNRHKLYFLTALCMKLKNKIGK